MAKIAKRILRFDDKDPDIVCTMYRKDFSHFSSRFFHVLSSINGEMAKTQMKMTKQKRSISWAIKLHFSLMAREKENRWKEKRIGSHKSSSFFIHLFICSVVIFFTFIELQSGHAKSLTDICAVQ